MLCDAETASPKEVFCKLSSGCDEGVTNLAREVIAVCLAADLGLPVPKPYLVEIPSTLADSVSDAGLAQSLKTSSNVGFGSSRAGNQYNDWMTGSRITQSMLPTAMSVFVFDAIIENVDRRTANPNCLISGEQIRLIDHELAFPDNAIIIGWAPPWVSGGLEWINDPEKHIFYKHLKSSDLDFSVLLGLWSAISDARLRQYRDAIPPEWSTALPAVDKGLDRIREARENINGVITEVERVLQ